MILFGEIQKRLPHRTSIVSSCAVPAGGIYEAAKKATLFRSVYPSLDCFRKALRESIFCIVIDGAALLYFDVFPDTMTLRVHGVFLKSPFRFVEDLKRIIQIVLMCSTIQRIECLFLSEPGKGLNRLLTALGFFREGILRRAYRDLGGTIRSGTMYSILREEVLDGKYYEDEF